MKAKADFLTLLRRDPDSDVKEGTILKHPSTLRVQIINSKESALLRIVDESGKPQAPCDYDPVGAIAPLLKILSDIEGRISLDFHWGETETDLPERTNQVLMVEMTPRQAKLY